MPYKALRDLALAALLSLAPATAHTVAVHRLSWLLLCPLQMPSSVLSSSALHQPRIYPQSFSTGSLIQVSVQVSPSQRDVLWPPKGREPPNHHCPLTEGNPQTAIVLLPCSVLCTPFTLSDLILFISYLFHLECNFHRRRGGACLFDSQLHPSLSDWVLRNMCWNLMLMVSA